MEVVIAKFFARTGRRRLLAVAAGAGIAATAIAVSGAVAGSSSTPNPGNSLNSDNSQNSDGSGDRAASSGTSRVAENFYIDPDGHAPQQVRAWESVGDQRAVWLRPLAEVPTAVWFSGGEPDVRAAVTDLTTRAAAADEVPVLVAYNVPGRDCGLYSSGGSSDPETYLAWVRSLAAGIGDRRAVVILEPDAVAQVVAGCEHRGEGTVEGRLALLAQAGAILAGGRATSVYLDAGNSGWVEDLDALADALREAGVAGTAGFALNVSNFRTSAESVAYGRRLSEELGGARFVVDTSRNGSGPLETDPDGLDWCNPVGRTVGTVPTTDTGDDRVDAFLWIKVPGDSDGSCRPGEPAAGTWWPDYALDLVMQTRMGHPWRGH